jgi:hypothetical protein
MIFNSTKFGGNRTKDVDVGPDRRTDRPIPIYPPPNYVCGGYKNLSIILIHVITILNIVLINFITIVNI